MPVGLGDGRRVFVGAVPGVLLTHPGGWVEGGSGPVELSAASTGIGNGGMEAFARGFVERHRDVKSREEVREAVGEEAAQRVEELRQRMREREEAGRRNEEVGRRIAALVAEREVERRVEEGWRRRREGRG